MNYDLIIAGGGTAGCVIANQLSANTNFRVLLLEAGPSNQGVLECEVPGLAMSLWHSGTPFDWNYTTVPQPGFNGQSVPYVKGHVLGGGSSTIWVILDEAPVFEDIILQPQGAYLNAMDDRELEQLIRDRGFAGFHAVGTASMSPKGAKYGVVYPDLTLKSTRGLRTADASVMAAVYGVAERAADLIKNAWVVAT